MLTVKVFQDRFYDLLDCSQNMTCLGDFEGFTEGFSWSETEQEMTFSALTCQKTWRWSEREGVQLLRINTNIGNGMCYDGQGRLIVCEQIGYRVARASRDMKDYQVIASEYNGKPFNSPNDVVVHSSGMIYFTDPHFGRRPTKHGRFGSQPQSCNGVYRIDPNSLDVTLAADQLDAPNGLCFSPDESKMYFTEGPTKRLTVMDILPDGMLTNPRLFAHTAQCGVGAADGIKSDEFGNIWATAEGGIQVFAPDGTILGVILLPESSGNLAFGGKHLDVLFMGSGSKVFTVKTKVRGIKLRW